MVQAPYLFYVNKAHVSFLENSDQVLWVCAVWSAGLRNVLFADLSGWSHLAKSERSICCSDGLVLSLCHCCVQCSCGFCRNIIWWLGYKLHGLLCTRVISCWCWSQLTSIHICVQCHWMFIASWFVSVKLVSSMVQILHSFHWTSAFFKICCFLLGWF